MRYKIAKMICEDDKGTSNCETRRENAGAATKDGRTGRRTRNDHKKGVRFVSKMIKWLTPSNSKD